MPEMSRQALRLPDVTRDFRLAAIAYGHAFWLVQSLMASSTPLRLHSAWLAFERRLAAALAFLLLAGLAAAEDAPLKIAVYDVPPYGHVEPDGGSTASA